jgi:predicted HicB family RNase H-like nuclease
VDIFHGEVIGLRDAIIFQGKTVDEVREAFRGSIDDYLEFCAKRGEEPEKPVTGKFMVRIPPDLHRKVYVAAKKSGRA